jgi:hypothetical protein
VIEALVAGEVLGRGSGRNRRAAETEAAATALEVLLAPSEPAAPSGAGIGPGADAGERRTGGRASREPARRESPR